MTYSLPNKVWLPKEYDSKATNIYARMAIFFDLNIYKPEEERNDTLLFQYMYHIIYMLSCKAKYFKKFEDYDAFALYMTTRLYMRYINPEHQEKHGKIKSVLNYIKTLLYPCKVDFQKETFGTIYGVDSKGNPDDTGELLRLSMEQSVQDSYNQVSGLADMIMDEINVLPDKIKTIIRNTPYRKDNLMSHRLYMSVLLSTLNSVTLPNAILSRLKLRASKGLNNDSIATPLYNKEKDSCVILWRLDKKYYNLVHILTIKARKKFVEDIGSVKSDLAIDRDDMNAIIMSAYGNVLRDNNEEW